MKQFFKVVMWIVILGAVCFGIYTILPEYPQSFVKALVQPVTNSQAKTRIGQVQNIPVTLEGTSGLTYKDVLEKNTGMSCWTYETKENEPGVEYVIYHGNGASMNLKDYADYNGKLATSALVKYEFKIRDGNQVDIFPYIDNEPMYILDGKHVEENKKIQEDILRQLNAGIQPE